jgi:hypothetical protein
MNKALEGTYNLESLEGDIGVYLNPLAESSYHYTLLDAYELILAIGFDQFLEALYKDKKGRSLTIEEKEAIQTLHERWEL